MNYNECFDNIISIKDPCATYTEQDPAPSSTSGYDLFDLPGISLKKANMIADEDYQNGLNLLKDKRRLAILSVQSELLAVMNANGMVAKTATEVFSTAGEFRNTLTTGTGLAGIRITNKVTNCALKKMNIQNVYVAPVTNVDVEVDLLIIDGGITYTYPIIVKPNKTTRVNVNIQAKTSSVYIYLSSAFVPNRYSINPNCGCGSGANSCAAVVGINNGTVEDRNESYGVWADVVCECDYSNLLCALSANGLMGEIVLYKTGVNVMDEALKTDRLNYFTIYGKEDAQATKTEWENIYREKWNLLVASLRQSIVNIDRCGCVDCSGVSIRSNI